MLITKIRLFSLVHLRQDKLFPFVLKQEYLHWRLTVLYLSLSVGTPWNECCFIGRVTRLGYFSPIGLFWKLIVMFCNVEVAQRNGNILGYFLVCQIFYIFTHINFFKHGLLCGSFRVSKVI